MELGLVNMDDGTAMCLKCNKPFSSSNQARVHYREIHMTDKSDKKFPCPLCNKQFAVKRYMSNHVRTIHGLTQSLMKRNYVPG